MACRPPSVHFFYSHFLGTSSTTGNEPLLFFFEYIMFCRGRTASRSSPPGRGGLHTGTKNRGSNSLTSRSRSGRNRRGRRGSISIGSVGGKERRTGRKLRRRDGGSGGHRGVHAAGNGGRARTASGREGEVVPRVRSVSVCRWLGPGAYSRYDGYVRGNGSSHPFAASY